MHKATVVAHPAGDHYAECTCGWWSLVVGPAYLAKRWADQHVNNNKEV